MAKRITALLLLLLFCAIMSVSVFATSTEPLKNIEFVQLNLLENGNGILGVYYGYPIHDNVPPIEKTELYTGDISLITSELTVHHGIDIDIYGPHPSTGALGHHIADLADDGCAHGGQIHAVVHHDVHIDGNGIILVELHPHALGHGFLAQQMVNAVGNRAGSHALHTEAVGCGGAGDIGINAGADAHRAVFVAVTNHRITSKY